MHKFKTYITENKILKPRNNDYDPTSKHAKSFRNKLYNCVKDANTKTGLDVQKSGHKYVYHGTTAEKAEHLVNHGLTTDNKDYKHGISFTGNPHEGHGYAHDRADESKSETGALIRIHKKHLVGGKVSMNDMRTRQNMLYKGNIPAHAIELVGKTK